jgi:hypothetical protein
LRRGAFGFKLSGWIIEGEHDLIPVWTDQRDTFTQVAFHLPNPYVINFLNPPWMAVLLMPFALPVLPLAVLIQLYLYFAILTIVIFKFKGNMVALGIGAVLGLIAFERRDPGLSILAWLFFVPYFRRSVCCCLWAWSQSVGGCWASSSTWRCDLFMAASWCFTCCAERSRLSATRQNTYDKHTILMLDGIRLIR